MRLATILGSGDTQPLPEPDSCAREPPTRALGLTCDTHRRHSGGYHSPAGMYQEFSDDSVMGYQRGRSHDMNVVSRHHLGWIASSQIATFNSSTLVSEVRALNEGPRDDGKVLLLLSPCRFCASINPETRHLTGGDLYLSFRVHDTRSSFGVASGSALGLYSVDTREPMPLVNRVHVHFQPWGARHSEIWKTLAVGDAFSAPGSTVDAGLHVKVCDVQVKSTDPDAEVADTEFATVAISATKADADACNRQRRVTKRGLLLAEGGIASEEDVAEQKRTKQMQPSWIIVDWDSGACSFTDEDEMKCITTKKEDDSNAYGNSASCTIRALRNMNVSATEFDVEDGHDYLLVDGIKYDRTAKVWQYQALSNGSKWTTFEPLTRLYSHARAWAMAASDQLDAPRELHHLVADRRLGDSTRLDPVQ